MLGHRLAGSDRNPPRNGLIIRSQYVRQTRGNKDVYPIVTPLVHTTGKNANASAIFDESVI